VKTRFQSLLFKFNLCRYSVGTAIPEVPAGFEESASALPLRKSFEVFAAFGKGSKSGTSAAESVAGRDWAKMMKDCGLIGREGGLCSIALYILI
jgi:hypothetical protein